MTPDGADDGVYARDILAALGVADVGATRRVQGGSDTSIWRVAVAGNDYALRVFGAGEQEDCEREATVMWSAWQTGLPVPKVSASGSWRGHPALLMDWAPGRTLFAELKRRPWRARRLGEAFGAMQAHLHHVEAPDVLADRPDDWIAWLGPDQPALAERLRASRYPAGALLHLDYHPLNVMTGGERITAILDWRNAAAGPPRADAARTHAILCVDAPAIVAPPVRPLLSLFASGWRAGYLQHGGSLDEMAPFYTWAGAVMLRDLAAKRSPADLARMRRWTNGWLARL
jgi:aminoglycoside phosphotransferase (APT) family kinase protein